MSDKKQTVLIKRNQTIFPDKDTALSYIENTHEHTEGEPVLGFHTNGAVLAVGNPTGSTASCTVFEPLMNPDWTATSGKSEIVNRPMNIVGCKNNIAIAPVVDKSLITDTTSTAISIAPVGGTTYKYGTLNTLTLTTIPDANAPLFIYFTSGTVATTLSVPSTVSILGYSIPQANTSYVISIMNGIITMTNTN